MSISLIEKSIIPLFIATVLLGGFFWQFSTIYPSIIDYFTSDKLHTIYAHLIIYSFLVFTLTISLANLLNYFILKSKIFIVITIGTLLTFYTLSYDVFNDLFHYFLNFPLSEDALMGLVLFMVTTFGYSLYSLFLSFFNRFVPLMHIFIFTLLALAYSSLFINRYCYPIWDIWSKF